MMAGQKQPERHPSGEKETSADTERSIPAEHRARGAKAIRCAVITVSDTRTDANDVGGDTVASLLEGAGHVVSSRRIVPDDRQQLTESIGQLTKQGEVAVILLTGGTGISPRDQTYSTVSGMFDSDLPGYGELFRMLSYEEIGPAAILSRATAGLIGDVVVLTMPGSPAAVRLAMERIILPELGHMVGQTRHVMS